MVKGADWFVDGAAGIAEKLHVPHLVIGLTVVAFGTSAPELATSIISSVQGSTGLAIGNIVGSNITNILLILGVAAIIANLPVYKDTLKIDFPVLIGASGNFAFVRFRRTVESFRRYRIFHSFHRLYHFAYQNRDGAT